MDQRNRLLPENLRPAEPPPELRGRVLAAARAATTNGGAADLWHRLWTSQSLRLAWAAATVGLLVGHLLIGADTSTAPAGRALHVAVAAPDDGELAGIADLGRLTAELPGWEIATPSPRAGAPERTSS